MKYYYTDALKAAWMSRELGVKYLPGDIVSIFEGEALKEYPYEMLCDAAMHTRINYKFYIHPDCYEMLKPQAGDIGVYESSGEYYPAQYLDIWPESPPFWGDSELLEIKKNCKIIQRNDKTWFTPEASDD